MGMNKIDLLLLDAIRCAIHRQSADWQEPLTEAEWRQLLRAARAHHVVPLLAEAVYLLDVCPDTARIRDSILRIAKRETMGQAQRTADFLLLYKKLRASGLNPVVMKGMICRNMYPQPEQRPSVDEDLLISSRKFDQYHEILTASEYAAVEGGAEEPWLAQETAYENPNTHLMLELHKLPFPPDSEAYGDCNQFFIGARKRSVWVSIYGQKVRTLEPTDHLLYLICHAYKHFLHGGVGIRQVCDIGMMAAAYKDVIDWKRIRRDCDHGRIGHFAEAVFRIAEKYLDLPVPQAFVNPEVNEEPLLLDIMSGGLYGMEDINRVHSGNMTLAAVASEKTGKPRMGVIRSIFLPLRSMRGRFPYLRKMPFLLPVAWLQRIVQYLTDRRGNAPVRPAETLRIGEQRMKLLKQYGIID